MDNDDNKPFIIKLQTEKSNILDNINSDNITKGHQNIVISEIINHPLISLGYHSFLHRTKNSMSITNNLETRLDYHIVNKFGHKIKNYNDDIGNYTKTFLGIKKDQPNIQSRAFYKMWEILYYFDIANQKKLVYAGIAEAPGSFLQSVLKFREYYNLGIENDKQYAITMNNTDDSNFIEFGKQFLNYYNNKYPNLINVHKTYPTENAKKFKSRDDGDITKIKTISLFKKEIIKDKNYIDLVTADGGFEWNDENYQEQEAYQLILGEAITALHIQAEKGHFVLKLFETFTYVTIKIIYILMGFYDEVYIHKPFMSRESNSERYLICKNFKFDQKKDKNFLNDKISILEDILEKMSTDKFTQDILTNILIPNDLLNQIKYINIKIANTQQITMNKIVTFIKSNNYFGEKYHNYRDEQINTTKWWINNFYKKTYKKYDLDKILNYYQKDIKQYITF